jgi:hypothetical protein
MRDSTGRRQSIRNIDTMGLLSDHYHLPVDQGKVMELSVPIRCFTLLKGIKRLFKRFENESNDVLHHFPIQNDQRARLLTHNLSDVICQLMQLVKIIVSKDILGPSVRVVSPPGCCARLSRQTGEQERDDGRSIHLYSNNGAQHLVFSDSTMFRREQYMRCSPSFG